MARPSVSRPYAADLAALFAANAPRRPVRWSAAEAVVKLAEAVAPLLAEAYAARRDPGRVAAEGRALADRQFARYGIDRESFRAGMW